MGVFNLKGMKVLIAFILVFSSMQGLVVHAAYDWTAPVISSIHVDKNPASNGDTVTVTINAIDNETPIGEVELWYTDGEGFPDTISAIYNQETKQAQVQIPITSNTSLGEMKLNTIWFTYTDGSFKTVKSTQVDLTGGNFTVIVKEDTTAPTYSSVSVDKKQVYSGDFVKISVNATDSESDIAEVKVNYQGSNGATQSINAGYVWYEKNYQATLPITDSMGIGNWSISSITLKDVKGNIATIESGTTDLSAGSFEILKKPDTQAPTLTGVSVDKNEVRIGETIKVSIAATDNEAGVEEVLVTYRDPSYNEFPKSAVYNSLTDKFELELSFPEDAKLGTWVIDSIYLIDNKGNATTIDGFFEDLSGGNFTLLERPDTVGPVFKGISVDKKEAILGDSIEVRILGEDVQSEIEEIKVSYLGPKGEIQTKTAEFNWFDKNYLAHFTPMNFSDIGNWQVDTVYLRDTKGNETTIYNSGIYNSGEISDLSSGNFKVLEDKGESFNNIRVYTTNVTLADETINGDVYIGPNAVLTITGNVVINGDLHVFGSMNAQGSLSVKGTWNMTKKLDKVPVFLDNQPLTAMNGKLNISGKTLPFVTMVIEDQPVSIGADGSFKLDKLVVTGKEGITIKFTDLSGNVTQRKFLLEHVTKTTIEAPKVSPITDQSTIVTGTTEANAEVTVSVGGSVIASGVAGTDGKFSISITKQKAGTSITVTVKDYAGNENSTTVVTTSSYVKLNIQLNGQPFTSGFFGNGITYVHWQALNTFKIPYTFKGNGIFTIEGRTVTAETINGGLYIKWNELSPENVTFTRITGGYNFIYKAPAPAATPLKVQLNGKDFTAGFFKDGNAYVHWQALNTFKIPFTYKGNNVFIIEGRTVVAETINGGIYIRWNLLSPGNVTFQKITGGYNFIYKAPVPTATPLKVQLNGKDFTAGFFKDGNAYVHWQALNTFKIPFTFKGNNVFIIEGRTVTAETINGGIYIRWNELSPGNVTFERITGGYNFIYTH